MNYKISLLLAGIFISSCSQETSTISETEIVELEGNDEEINDEANPSSSDSLRDIEFIRDITYGDTDNVLLGNIMTVAVDDLNRVYIGDSDHVTIHVYNSDGSYLKSIGQEGRGPGEFLNVSPSTNIEMALGQLFVTGTENMFTEKIHVFSLEDLSFSHDIMLRNDDKENFDENLEDLYPLKLYPRRDGSFLVAYQYTHSPEYFEREENVIRYYIHDKNGVINYGPVLEHKDRIYLYHKGWMYFANRFPFLRKPLFAVSDDDRLYSAWTEEFRIDLHHPGGEHLQTIEHPFENRELTRGDIQQEIEECDKRFDDGVCEQMIRNAKQIPETWPALESMLIDDENRLWVSTIIDDDEIYEWWVLEDSGELITKFNLPRDEPVEAVKNGYLYARETEEETGLQQIVRYRVE